MKSENIKPYAVLFIYISIIKLITCSYPLKDNVNFITNENSQLEVRAVMKDPRSYLDGESVRFQREELFKHNVLQNCKQKLAVTVKMASDPGKPSGDEYIPIEHVLDADKKRIRLLNPYVLRLRRRLPFEAYHLKRIDTVTGIIVEAHGETLTNLTGFNNRVQRDLSAFPHRSDSNMFASKLSEKDFNYEGNRVSNFNEHMNKQETKQNNLKAVDINEKSMNTATKDYKNSDMDALEFENESYFNTKETGSNNNFKKKIFEESSVVHGNIKNEERDFALYEIGDPKIWYSTHLQLFEKLINPQGKTLWNDLTKEETARVSTKNPEWLNHDLTIRLKPIQLLTREDYILPLHKLSLLVPLKVGEKKFYEDKYGDFLIVPKDDVITLTKIEPPKKKVHLNENIANYNEASNGQHYRRVVVRATGSIRDDNNEFKLIFRGSKQFLKVPHKKPHYSQIDIEARADSNELVLVGAFGRLMTIVSDSTRRTRSVLTVLATNMGLAAARFRVVVRECTPALMVKNGGEILISGPTLLPPRHTQTFSLDIPMKIPIERAQCIVALVNENDETIAVRDVTIKRDDRCFCVWHCDCVCLSEDPKLLCRSLPAVQIIAAGLQAQAGVRHVRSLCYPDVVSINLFVTIIGVLFAFFIFGFIKAFLGLILQCVGSCGLYLLLQTPRKLERYYESSLRSRQVVYDKDGWPVHPDTKQRSVRLVSKPMEFILNLMFFIILPCAMIWEAVRKLTLRCHSFEKKSDPKYSNCDRQKCFSSHDVQGFELLHHGRHKGLRKWMSPQAEELSNKVVQKGLTPEGCMRPLLREKQCCGSNNDKSLCMDSEQDDTEYVMMQMKKSRESLAKTHRKVETVEDPEMNADNKKR